METKTSETQNERPKITAYSEEEIFALIDFAWTDSTSDLNSWSCLGGIKGNPYR